MKTLALVLGNNDYHDSAKLINAVNDAKEIADVFKRLGYEVILRTNQKTQDYEEILENIKKIISEYDAFIFYYAGHGFQVKGENYLTSIDAQIQNSNEYHIKNNSISLSEIFDLLLINRINILIIDACRTPTEERGFSIETNNINVPKGTIIAFSTSPNKGAYDNGFEEHSIYTGALLKHLASIKDYITVEELFKKVRKTVYDLSGGKQVTWEHTSLIGDFRFNMGQIIYDIEIPYNERVVKDANYIGDESSISKIIMNLREHNWYVQNPALDKFLKIPPKDVNKDDLFIIGRNILQSAEGNTINSIKFIENIDVNLQRYFTENNENHLLNGILFEMYFDSLGEFRKGKFKKYYLEIIFALRKKNMYSKSFEFIHKILQQYKEELFYIPNVGKEENIDINISAILKKDRVSSNVERIYQEIQSIKILDKDIIDIIYDQGYIFGEKYKKDFELFLSNLIFAPRELFNIISNIPLSLVTLKENENLDSPFW
ncbi:caspase family protein [Capnocytophaga ochracea]|uniref:Uncharacterized protein containing caspase domain n=1 Tax=Capnocytophaga ochracea TaxID=1018 RepID=A0A2X2SSD2_CAPOC|nr:caspase family protein [Capnocytophaga ochracea]SQA95078.1 Uncharacterized protein containing caspase domain [Capnocytophaga ochracea]